MRLPVSWLQQMLVKAAYCVIMEAFLTVLVQRDVFLCVHKLGSLFLDRVVVLHRVPLDALATDGRRNRTPFAQHSTTQSATLI